MATRNLIMVVDRRHARGSSYGLAIHPENVAKYSYVNMNGEAFLFKVLQSLRNEGKLIILVSHRSSILQIIDRIIEIKRGKIHRILTAEEFRKNKNKADDLSLKFS